jgi:hypothetical protein
MNLCSVNLPRHYLVRLAAASVVCAIALLGTAQVRAAVPPITWSAAQTVSGDSDVDTTGSFVYAFTFGGTAAPPSTTVNGVTFSPFTIPSGIVTSATVGNVTISESPGTLFGSNSFGSVSAPFSGLSSSYQSLLGTGAYADNPSTITVSLKGLTSGQQYRLQWWTSNASNQLSIYGDSFSNTTATAFNSVTLDANITNLGGGLGQFAIGTFTASGTIQSFSLTETSGGFNPLINALQVRAVPEPSTCAMALAALACGGYSLFRRRKRA